MNEFYLQILMLVLLFAVMYFILIRPQKKREKEVSTMRDNLKVGDDIVTIGGIYGKVVRIREDRFTIQAGAEKVRLDVAKWSISQKVNKDEKTSKIIVNELENDTESEKTSKPTPKTIKKIGNKEQEEE